MKKFIRIVTGLFLFSIITSVAAQPLPIDLLWQKVKSDMDNDLPKSAIETLKSVEKLARDEGNNDQLLKATRQRWQLEERLYIGDFSALAPQFEVQASQTKNPVEQALLYEKTSSLYLEYYSRNEWRVNERPRINDMENDSIDNWNRERFLDAIFSMSDHSFANDELKNSSTKEYPELLRSAGFSDERCPTLYDYFVSRSIKQIENLWQPWNYSNSNNAAIERKITELYDRLIAFDLEKNEVAASVYNQVARLEYLKSIEQVSNESFLSSLEQLEEKYKETRYITVIMRSKIEHYIQQGQEEGNEKAYLLAKKVLEKYTGHPDTDRIKELLLSITQPLFSGSMSNCYPDAKIPFNLYAGNIDSIDIEFYRISESPVTLSDNYRRFDTLLPSAQLKSRYGSVLKKNLPYWHNSDTLLLPPLPLGLYQYKITAQNQDTAFSQYGILPVSELAGLSRRLSKGETNCWVVTSKEGQPIAGASVLLYEADNNGILQKKETLTTDKDGLCTKLQVVKGEYFYRICHKNDTASLPCRIPYYWEGARKTEEKKTESLYLFTDRSIYRPGETVYFKGILVEKTAAGDRILSGRLISVSLLDPKWKSLTSIELRSNEFGSIEGSFRIPDNDDSNGHYTIRTDKGQVSFNVEHYKRPNFETTLTEDEMGYLAGQEVVLNGISKTYSGIPLQNATYEYTVVRQSLWLTRMMPFENSKETIASEKGKLGSDGRFTARFVSLPPDTINNIKPVPYDIYSRENDIPALYTISGSITDSRGETQTFEKTVMIRNKRLFLSGDLSDERFDKSKGITLTLTGKNVNQLDIEVNGSLELLRINGADSVSVLKHNFIGGEKLTLDVAKSASGRYLLRAVASSKLNEEAKWQQEVILYGLDDKRPPVDTTLWVVPVSTELGRDKEAVIIVGSTEKNLALLYELFGEEGSIIDRKVMKLNNENQTIRVPNLKALARGGAVSLNTLRDNQLITENIYLTLPPKAAAPEIKWETWRDKLYPSDSDTVTLRVTGKEGILEAEVLATMYDASLDAIAPHNWNLNRFSDYNSIYIPWFTQNNNLSSVYLTAAIPQARGGNVLSKGMVGASAPMFAESVATDDESMVMADMAVPEQGGEAGTGNQLRTDFAATAFFYPALRTDSDGRVSFSFKVPQSLTTWKLKVLASTKEGTMSQSSQTVITQKELMVTPLLPRFIREGDSLRVRAAVNNLLPKEQEVVIECLFINPANGQTLFQHEERALIPASGESIFDVPLSVSGFTGELVCRFKATGAYHADGVEQTIPVLPSYITVKEGESIELKGGETYLFATASPNGTPKQIDIEVSSNLIAYVIKAIPELTLPQTDDAVSWMASFYTAALSEYLFSIYPDMAGVVKERGLANANRIAYLKGRAAEQLRKLQSNNGGWAWFDGMQPSVCVTLQILKNLSQLNTLNAVKYSTDEKETQKKAVVYLDRWIEKSYKELKDKAKYNLTATELDYLYIRSLYPDISQSEGLREAIGYYTGLAQKQWKEKPLTIKLTTALLARAAGDEKTVAAISRSVGEYPLPENVAEATMLLRFYGSSEKEKSDALARFILKNKKSNVWRSATETMDALYTLCRVSNPETAKNGVLTIKEDGRTLVNKQLIRPMVVDSFSFDFGQFGAKNTRLELSNDSEANLWIGAIRRFDEQLSDAAPYNNGITVERQYYKSEQEGTQEVLTPIKEGDAVKIGDKITVRLKVSSPEERSYVRLRDYFPANLENGKSLSGSRFYEGSWIYETQNDRYKSFYIEQLKKGTTLFEYSLYAAFNGNCVGGYAEAESLFAEEFGGHTQSVVVIVK